MRIFAAGIATETNTQSPLPTSIEDYIVQRGSDVLRGRVDYPSLDLTEIWGKPAKALGHEFVFSLNAWAQPSGITVKSAYESLRDEMLEDLRRAMPVDVVLLMLHGAMVAQTYDDCEEDIIRRVRNIVGRDAVIGIELDLHCHLSETMIAPADIVVTYKEYPHVDMNDRAEEVFRLAVDTRLGKIKPTTALFDCQMVGMYPTSRQPLRAFIDEIKAAEQHHGVLSISFGHGFQFADLSHVGAKMLVITDDDQALADQLARKFGSQVYGLRRHIGFDSMSLPMDEAFATALATSGQPVVLADQSDNTGGGAPGDATFAMRWLLDHEIQNVALAILHDPEVVKIARKAGVGATLPVRLGGKVSARSGDPVDVEVTVLSTLENYMHVFPQESGDPALFPVGNVVALRCAGNVDVVVGSERCQCFSPSIFSDLGIDPSAKRLLIPKSYQHFYGAFEAIAADIIYMAGPGAVPPDPRLIAYSRLNTHRLYPWVEDPMRQESARNPAQRLEL